MIRVQTLEDVYPALEELIAKLKAAGQTRLASILHHRLHEVAWNTRSELFEELQNVIIRALESDDATFPQLLKEQMEQVLLVIGKFLDRSQVRWARFHRVHHSSIRQRSVEYGTYCRQQPGPERGSDRKHLL